MKSGTPVVLRSAEDFHIVQGVVQSDESAAAAFVERFGAPVFCYLRKRGVLEADLPDVCQETLASSLHQLRRGRFLERAALATWVFRIANNKANDYWRRRFRTAPPREIVRSRNERWCAEELEVLLGELLCKLPAKHAAAFRGWFIEGRAIADIAAAAGLSTSRVRAILARTKRLVTQTIRT